MQKSFRGTGVAVVTPFKDDKVDFDALERIIEHLINGKVEYLVSLGTTGESVTLSEKECREVFDFTIEKANSRVPLVAGVFGGNNTAALKEKISGYNLEGFDAILSSSPAYSKPTQEGIYRHYMELGEVSPLPIIVYNVPGRTCSNITAATCIRIAKGNEKFIAVKEASGDIAQGTKIIKEKPKDFLVLSGDDPTCLSLCASGGDGVITVIGNAYPRMWSDMVRYAIGNQMDKAKNINLQLQHLHKWLYIEGNPVGIKAAMEYKGLCSRDVRLPLVSMSSENFQNLKKAMDYIEDLNPQGSSRT